MISIGWRTVAAACVAATLALAAGCRNGERLEVRYAAGPPIGGELPRMALTDLGGQPYDLAWVDADALLLNLWATWCVPCLEEMPELAALADRYAPSELAVVGISVDHVDATAVIDFLEAQGIGYLNLMAPLEHLVEALDVDPGIPHTLLVDRDRIVRGYWRGRFHPSDPHVSALLDAVVGRAHP